VATFAELIAGAQFRADLQNTQRVTLSDWCRLLTDAIDDVWNRAVKARPDFQFSSQDFTLVSAIPASFNAPGNFHTLIDVVFAPDTESEYSLGPFNWHNRKAPGRWFPWTLPGVPPGADRARLMGRTIFVEPALRAAGNYRLWYCPRPKAPRQVARLVATGLPAFTATGAGIGKILSENGSTGVLTIDAISVAQGDRILIRLGTVNDGIYVVTSMTPGSPWVLTRATDYDEDSEIGIGDGVYVSDGASLGNSFWELSAFGGVVDTNAMTFRQGGGLDPILIEFIELIKIRTAIPAMLREDDLDTSKLEARAQGLELSIETYFGIVRGQNSNTKAIDTDKRGPFPGWGYW